MDWKAIKAKGNAFKDKALDLGGKAVDKTLTALEKTAGHTYDGLKKTAVSIKNGTQLDDAKNASLSVVFVVGKDDAASRAILVRMPVLMKDAWLVSANLKVILSPESPELLSVLDFSDTDVPAVLVYRKGTLQKRLTGEEAVAFSKKFDVSTVDDSPVPEVPEGKTDILAEAVAKPVEESIPETSGPDASENRTDSVGVPEVPAVGTPAIKEPSEVPPEAPIPPEAVPTRSETPTENP